VAVAKIKNDLKYNTIKKGDQGHAISEQKRQAVSLMVQAGLGSFTGMCGMNEIVKIQTFLEPEYQIKIFSKDAFNDIIYQGTVFSVN